MLSNFHTHTTFCDGKGTPEEVVKRAIEFGMRAIGFSGHGYTPYDLRYCMKDTEGYINEVNRLKEKFKSKIEIYLGIEEDSRAPADRAKFDYVIGSCHYYESENGFFPIDSNYDYFSKGLAAFGGDALAFAEHYYQNFCSYITERKPDIIGHFDLVTKFDEKEERLFLDSEKYHALSEKYVRIALRAGSLFEVNTGLMSRGYRTSPCPDERLLRIIKNEGGGIVLSSDSHHPDTLCHAFTEAKALLRDAGFDSTYTLSGGKWVREML